MTHKYFQIRDDGTHIPALALQILVTSDNRELKRAGWKPGQVVLSLTNLNTMETQYDWIKWNSRRTMQEAHKHIEQNWQNLNDGDVVDIEFILGETPTKKDPE